MRVVDEPLVMGIINVTPDSFYTCCQGKGEEALLALAEGMMAAGADILDIGGYSTRPGAAFVSEEEEWRRLEGALRAIRQRWQDVPLSVDTWRSGIALKAVERFGADIINDVSGGEWDAGMFDTVTRIRACYILTHTGWAIPTSSRGSSDAVTPAVPQTVERVLQFLQERVDRLHRMGVMDVIVDPGFGFGKTIEENFALLRNLRVFGSLHCPVLAGLSRKSMLYKSLNTDAAHALNATTAVNMIALQNGADILRVHDVREAREAVLMKRLTDHSLVPDT